MRRFELSDGVSNKFWEVEQVGCEVQVRYGKIGTAGQSQSKSHADESAATLALDKLIKEKTGKGYAEFGGSPSAAPLKPGAATPAAKKTATKVEAPAATPVEAHAAQPAAPMVWPSDTPPWLACGSVVDMPAKMAAQALPSRRFPGPAPRTDADARWNQFLANVKEHIIIGGTEGDIDYLHAVLEAQERLAGGLRDGSPTSDAVLLAVETAYEAYKNPADGAPFLDYLAASKGLVYACEVFVAMQTKVAYDSSWRRANATLTFVGAPTRELARSTNADYSWTELALRSHLAHADETLWRQCAALLGKAIDRLPPRRKPLICVLLPELPELADELGLANGARQAEHVFTWLLMVAKSGPALSKIRLHKQLEWYTFGFYINSQALATVVRDHGTDAVALLEDGATVEEAARVLSCIGTPEALTVLARASAHNKDCLLRFAEAARRWPLAAVAALSEMLAAEKAPNASLGSILATHARSHAEALPAMRPWLSAPAWQLLEKLSSTFGMALDIADAAELPPVLANPPWKGKARKALGALALEPLPLPAVESWPQDARESIFDSCANYRKHWKSASEDPLALARMMRIDEAPFDKRAAAAIVACDPDALLAVVEAYRATGRYCDVNPYAIAHLPPAMGAAIWNGMQHRNLYSADYAVATFGLAGLPAVVDMIDKAPVLTAHHGVPFGATELALPMARAFARLKKVRAIGRQWLLTFPEHAACGLIAPALGKAGETRDCAAIALRMLATQGHEALLMSVAARYPQPQVAGAMRAMLDEDPLDLHPSRFGPLPSFWNALGWSRPILARNGKALPESVLEHIGAMMRFPIAGGAYAGIAQLKQACTSQSLADFGWDAFRAWIDSGAPSKESWVLTALGYIGNDDTARKLVPLVREWPSEGQSNRAVSGLEVLAQIGTDTAVMLLHGIAQKAKSRPLQDSAREKITQIAEARELSAEELADRITPDLGLDERGTLTLDFGPRSFQVGFDEALKPYVRDRDGARLADLPKPKQSDDETLSTAATDRYKRLKKDARAIAAQQVQRLEAAMCVRRRWEPKVFSTFLAAHPLVRTLVQRIVWGVYRVDDGANHGGELLSSFRVSPDGDWTTSLDDACALPAGDGIRIGIPHALEMSAADATAFGQLFADYELLQPFAQIGRDTHALDAADIAGASLTRWAAIEVPTKSVLGLSSRGWRKGTTESKGMIWNYTKDLGQGKVLEITLEPGISAGMMDYFPKQKVTEIRTGTANRAGDVGSVLPISSLHPVAISELVRDMEKLRE